MESQIHSEVQKEVDQSQREFFLREQLKTIQKELGEIESGNKDVDELREKIDQAGMPEAVAERARKELERLHLMPSAAPEVGVIRTYIEWLVALPWSVAHRGQPGHQGRAPASSTSTTSGWARSRSASWSTWRCASSRPRCAAPSSASSAPRGWARPPWGAPSPPRWGASSCASRSAACATRRRSGATGAPTSAPSPGRIIQTMRQAGTVNPVFMLDEVDKLGMDFRGDPSSALLEVLDPEQNVHFSDHYLEVPYDLSQVIFIATANQLDPVPPPLRDRMEVIELPGYVEEEKLAIARRFLVPRQLAEHGLTAGPPALHRRRPAPHHPRVHPRGGGAQSGAGGGQHLPARWPGGSPTPSPTPPPTPVQTRRGARGSPGQTTSGQEQEQAPPGPGAGAAGGGQRRRPPPLPRARGASPQAWPRSRTRSASPPASPGAPWAAT